MNNNNELKKYLNGFTGTIGIGIFLMIIGIVLALVAAMDFDTEEFTSYLIAGAGLVGILIGAFVLFAAFSNKKDLDQIFKNLNNHGLMGFVINDFNKARKISSDKGRLGDNYIYFKKANTFFTYDKIVQMYEYVHRTNLAVDERAVTVRYINNDGKILEQKLPVANPLKNEQEIHEIMAFLLSKNPGIKIGYDGLAYKKKNK